MNTVQLYESDELKQQRAIAILQERTRLARELHDTIGQVLGYVRLQAYTAQQLLSRGQIAEANVLLNRLIEVAESSQAEVRDEIFGLSMPLPLNAQVSDLINTLRSYVNTLAGRYPTHVTFSADPKLFDRSMEPDAEAQTMRIVQEALNNANKHGTAEHIWITLTLEADYLHGVIEDDGQGFSPDAISQSSAPKFGLRIMSERAQETGGRLQVLTALGQGTKVVFDIPCKPQRAQSAESIQREFSKDTTNLLASKVVPV